MKPPVALPPSLYKHVPTPNSTAHSSQHQHSKGTIAGCLLHKQVGDMHADDLGLAARICNRSFCQTQGCHVSQAQQPWSALHRPQGARAMRTF